MQRTSSHLLTPHSSRLAPRAFTLVELLVVITIIAILASLLVVAASAAMNRARFARIKTELNQLDQGIEQYRNEVSGGDYPPNAMISGSMAALSGNLTLPQLQSQVKNDLVRHFKKVSTRTRREEEPIIACLAGANFPGATVYNESGSTGTTLIGGLSPAEALVFYLNGFSSDPKAPITGSGGPAYDIAVDSTGNGGTEGRKPVFQFETTRLGPRDSNGNFSGRYIQFQLNSNGPTYRLNLWRYYPAGSSEPMVYLDTSRPVMDVEPVLVSGYYPTPHAHAIKQPSSSATVGNEIRYANEGKFQILHCGLDEKWGDFDPMSIVGKTPGSLQTQMLLSPKGPFTLDLADTITNFTTGTLEDAQP